MRRYKSLSFFCGDNLIFAGIQFLFWAGFGTLFVFITGYMESLHFGSVRIGVVRAVGAVGGIIGSMFWGAIADKRGKIGTITLAILIGGIVTALPFSVAGGRLLPFILIFFMALFLLFPIITLLDSWITQVAHLNPVVSYGITRAIGSLGFACAVTFAGGGFDRYGIDKIFLVYAAIFTLLIPLIALQTRRTQHRLAGVKKPATAPGRTVTADQSGSPLLNQPLRSFFSICTVMLVCFSAAVTFLPLLASAVGGSHRDVGLAFSVMAISEVPVMMCSAVLLRRFRDTRIIFLSCLFFAFRVASHLLAYTPTLLIAVQPLQAGCFGLFIPAAVSLCNRISRRSNRVRSLALLNIIIFGISSTISGLIGGWFIALFGIRGMYAIISIIVLIPVFLYWRLFIAGHHPARRRLSKKQLSY